MEELRIELGRIGIPDLRPLDRSVLNQAKVLVNRQEREKRGARNKPDDF